MENAIWTGWGFGGILSSIDARKQYLSTHPEINQSPPVISSVTVNNNLVEANVFNASLVEFMVTTSDYNSKFQSFTMNDSGIDGDILANDGIYSIQMPFSGNTNVKFYIRTRNEDAIMLSPERAEYEFYEYSTISNIFSDNSLSRKKIMKIYDVLGRESSMMYNQPMMFLYSDGTIEKRIIVK